MLEIREEPNWDLALEETDKSKGEEAWFFTELTKYIEKNRVERQTLHHLCALCLDMMEMRTFRVLKPTEKARLTLDLERMLMRIYYPFNKRNFYVELVDDYFDFYLDDALITKITLKKFEEDLKREPDIKLNVLQEFYGANELRNKRMSFEEREDLAGQMVKIYEDLLEQRSIEEMKEQEAKRLARQNRKGLFGRKKAE